MTCNISFERQRDLPVKYKGILLDCGYRIDVLVLQSRGRAKGNRQARSDYEAQLITHLRLGGSQVGLLINFNATVLVDGIRRRVMGLKE